MYLPDGAGAFTPQELVTSPELCWPDHVTAISHVGMTIPPDDAYRGTDSLLIVPHLQGESGVAAISDFNALRLRYNPFFSLLAERVVTLLNEE